MEGGERCNAGAADFLASLLSPSCKYFPFVALDSPLRMHLLLLLLLFDSSSGESHSLTEEKMELRVEFLEKALLLLEDKMDNMIEKEVVKVMAKRDADVIRMKEKIKVLEAELEKKNLTMNCCEVKKYPPALMVCAYQDQWREANSTISFDNITAEYTGRREDMMRTNSDVDSEVGPLEVESGTFRSPVRGFYRVTFSGGADLHPGKVKKTPSTTTTTIICR